MSILESNESKKLTNFLNLFNYFESKVNYDRRNHSILGF